MTTLTIDSAVIDIPENFHQIEITTHMIDGRVHALQIYHYTSIGLIHVQRLCATIYNELKDQPGNNLVKTIYIL